MKVKKPEVLKKGMKRVSFVLPESYAEYVRSFGYLVHSEIGRRAIEMHAEANGINILKQLYNKEVLKKKTNRVSLVLPENYTEYMKSFKDIAQSEVGRRAIELHAEKNGINLLKQLYNEK